MSNVNINASDATSLLEQINTLRNCSCDISPNAPNLNMEDILKIFLKLLSQSQPLKQLPASLIIAGSKSRPGLSPRKIAARIISRQAEAGAYIGPLPDGSENVMEKMWAIAIEEMSNSILNEMVVQMAIAPGVQISGNAGPIPVVGQTSQIAKGNGIAR